MTALTCDYCGATADDVQALDLNVLGRRTVCPMCYLALIESPLWQRITAELIAVNAEFDATPTKGDTMNEHNYGPRYIFAAHNSLTDTTHTETVATLADAALLAAAYQAQGFAVDITFADRHDARQLHRSEWEAVTPTDAHPTPATPAQAGKTLATDEPGYDARDREYTSYPEPTRSRLHALDQHAAKASKTLAATLALAAALCATPALARESFTIDPPSGAFPAYELPYIGNTLYSDSCEIVQAFEDHSAIAYCTEDGVSYVYVPQDQRIPLHGISFLKRAAGWHAVK